MKLEVLILSAFLAGTVDCFSRGSSRTSVGGINRGWYNSRVRSATGAHHSLIASARKQASRKRPRVRVAESEGTDDGANTENFTLFDLPRRLQEAIDHLGRQPNLCEKSRHLVALGDAFSRTDSAVLRSCDKAQKIKGCTSEVYVAVSLVCPPGQAGAVVCIRGTSDARVSRGILALLAQGLEGEEPSTVLSLKREAVARAVGLRAGLTESRINGLGNILKTIQVHVKELLDSSAADGNEALTTVPMTDEHVANHRTQSSSPSQPENGRAAGQAGEWFPIPGMEDEVAVLLSGGVDSSVALRLLQDQGYRVRAFYLKIWLEDELAHLGECPWEEDLAYAAAVCEQAGVPLETVPLQREYWEQVVAYTVREAREGRTPNPDVMCNSRIKFGMFYDYVGRHFRHVATGHYARLERNPERLTVAGSGGDRDGGQEVEERVRLMLSPDSLKDQTYFLCTLTQSQLRKALFPLGDYTKDQIRELAVSYDLPTKHRKDSQGICFLGKLKFDEFLKHYLGESPGAVVDRNTGEIIGDHRGLWFHTIGQRKGVGPTLHPGNVHRGPWYVSGKHIGANVLEVTNRFESVDGPRESFQVEALQWIAGRPPPELEESGWMNMKVKTRHGPQMNDCVLRLIEEKRVAPAVLDGPRSPAGAEEHGVLESETRRVHVRLSRKDSGLAPGQFAAFYLNQECLGAGIISDSHVARGGSTEAAAFSAPATEGSRRETALVAVQVTGASSVAHLI